MQLFPDLIRVAAKTDWAHGKGVAQGIDHYQGHFFKGMPDGKGIYKWADGTYYEGQWKNGMREGMGKMVYKDSIINGYWKDGKYLGEKLNPPFRIINSRSVARYTIKKSTTINNGVKIRILQGGDDNRSIEGFSLASSSGDEYRVGNIYGIQNSFLPLDIKIRYRTWNQMYTAQHDVVFEITIYDPGTWEIVIYN